MTDTSGAQKTPPARTADADTILREIQRQLDENRPQFDRIFPSMPYLPVQDSTLRTILAHVTALKAKLAEAEEANERLLTAIMATDAARAMLKPRHGLSGISANGVHIVGDSESIGKVQGSLRTASKLRDVLTILLDAGVIDANRWPGTASDLRIYLSKEAGHGQPGEAEGDAKLPPPPTKGEYVFATKYADGSPWDQWAVGFYDRPLPSDEAPRHLVVDGEGNNFRANGFRRVEKIDRRIAAKLIPLATGLEGAYGVNLWDEVRRLEQELNDGQPG